MATHVKPLTREEIANTEKKLDMPLDDIIRLSKNNTNNNAKKPHRVPNKNQKLFRNAAQDRNLKMRRYMDSRPFVRQGFLAQRRSNFQGNRFPVTTEVARKASFAPFNNRPYDRYVAANQNKARVGAAFTVQRRAANGGPNAKSPPRQQQQQPQGDGNSMQRPKTLDSLFANLKEQRMRIPLRQNNNLMEQRVRIPPRQNNNLNEQRTRISPRQNNYPRYNGYNGDGGPPRVPWARGRFGN